MSLTQKNDWVLDPFLGVGTTVISAVRHGRRGCGSEKMEQYALIAHERVQQAMEGVLPVRTMNTPVYAPAKAGKSLTRNNWSAEVNENRQQLILTEE